MAHQQHWPMEWLEQASAEEPQPLLVCQYCGVVRDDTAREREQTAAWMTMAAYRRKHAVQLRDVPFVHTYCPTCLPRIQGTRVGHKDHANSAPAQTSIRSPLRVWIDRGWLAFLKGMIERKGRR
ncbi:MAG: hypothetical protein OEV38_18540 [Nitrospira sp.]|nr:hypothetical protein [Nitrospira sp.]MDH4358163.1 hypothetical protein [Nitrospira sp.]MDH5320569.1 hypothetical protein [Nitrospira sp.]